MIESRYPEKPEPENPQGAKRKWPHWLIVALAFLKPGLPYTWREFAEKISEIEPVLQAHGADEAPSMGSLYLAWSEIDRSQLENLVKLTGRRLCPNPDNVAIDSSGFLFKGGSVWILLKWVVGWLKKNSRQFYKAHMIVETTTKAIMGVRLSQSHEHDLTIGKKLIQDLGKRILANIYKIFGDKAYTSQDYAKKLQNEFGIEFIVQPRDDLTVNGENARRDNHIKLHKVSPELWKYTHNYNEKSSVEQVFATIKQYPLDLTARLRRNRKKQLVMRFFVYNINLLLEQ